MGGELILRSAFALPLLVAAIIGAPANYRVVHLVIFFTSFDLYLDNSFELCLFDSAIVVDVKDTKDLPECCICSTT